MVKPLNGLQVRSILDHDEELEALLSRVAASRRLVIDVDPAEKTRSDGQALVAVTIALTTNFGCRAGQGVRSRQDLRLLHRRHATAANQRIADALGTQDTKPDPGNEGDGDTEHAS